MAVSAVLKDEGTKMEFETGAHRSSATHGDKKPLRLDLIPIEPLIRLGRTYGEGAVKYGDNNWKRGFPATDLATRTINHVYRWLDGNQEIDEATGEVEDDLAHAAWNLFALMYNEERLPHMIDVPTRKEYEEFLKWKAEQEAKTEAEGNATA